MVHPPGITCLVCCAVYEEELNRLLEEGGNIPHVC